MTTLAAAGEPGGDKAPDAFRTISEVAEDLDLPQHVLRFWETRFTQIRPLKRGGNRRYYRPDDVDLLRGVRQLLYGQGYTIRGVQRILRERGMRFVQAVGRGEQVAPAAFPEAEAEPEREPPPGPPLAPADRAALTRLLDDLRGCRERLVALQAALPRALARDEAGPDQNLTG
ncbi:MerR family transcriptional regulator [Methylobacterium nodulans]|uniref:Transcriptional regulator, MerR family n=1 Tax=Methylobacterium nodulans (strain LMG 21967 / CNCM I-2342 / ORS 2060) TaxID=460265 RepID=B8IJ18_METNO|nr:MerR family transcriptional regulator [Methylobacterium nodulans]ACL61813.1 transcriptional regulator, MerR family [Methylobacterium nodulans ORS 2060]